MTTASSSVPAANTPPTAPRGWWRTEDWWAVWLGLGIVAVAYALFASGTSIAWLAVAPEKWSNAAQLGADLAATWPRYLAQFAVFAALFTGAMAALGHRPRAFLPAFTALYLGALAILVASAWDQARRYNLEAPLLALFLGLVLANLARLPRWLDEGFRVEFYIKLGIVMLGATLPFTLIVWAGPVAILQASVVSLATFFTIFLVGRRLGLDRRLAATLGAGGAVCGVSAAIAVAGAVRARKEDPPIAISLVVLWAIVMIFALPFAARALHLPAGVGGAWIGTSEFADAAGLAAAQAYGGMAGPENGITGTPDQAIASYTLIKVIGRDVWIGIWCFVLAFIAVTRWERAEHPGLDSRAQAGQIWTRFPKFVLGFLVASLLVTVVVHGYSLADYNKQVKPSLIAPITTLRTWAFTFSFLSIGLCTRWRDLTNAGSRPFLAFTAGVVVNVILGYVLSTQVFGSYWAGVATH